MQRYTKQRDYGWKVFMVFLLLLAVGAAAHAEYEPPLRPVSPQIMGQGGCPVASVNGYDALFMNPASFASSEGSFTFYSSSFWLYADPLQALRSIISSNPSTLQSFMDDQITSGGFGFGSSDGIGYVGKSIAAAAVITIDTYLWGATVGSAEGELVFTLAFISGFAYPFQLKDFKLTLGFDIRPMIRILAPIDELVMQDFLDAFSSDASPLATLNTYNALHGFALAVDLGAIFEWESVRWGVTFRDFLGTRFKYTEDTFGDILVSLRDTGGFPTGGPLVDDHVIPMDISTSFAYTFGFSGSKVFTDLVLHWALCDIFTVAAQKLPPASMLHAGAEVGLWRRLKMRFGFNQGYLTFGVGAKLWLLDLNLAYFTREMGFLDTTRANSGLTVEAAIRR